MLGTRLHGSTPSSSDPRLNDSIKSETSFPNFPLNSCTDRHCRVVEVGLGKAEEGRRRRTVRFCRVFHTITFNHSRWAGASSRVDLQAACLAAAQCIRSYHSVRYDYSQEIEEKRLRIHHAATKKKVWKYNHYYMWVITRQANRHNIMEEKKETSKRHKKSFLE